MTNITLGKLSGSFDALNKLSALKLKPAVSFKVATFLRKAQENLKTYNEQRKALLEEYGTVDIENPEQYQLAPEVIPEFNAAMEELHASEVEGLITPQVSFVKDIRDDQPLIAADFGPLVDLIFIDLTLVGKPVESPETGKTAIEYVELPVTEIQVRRADIMMMFANLRHIAGTAYQRSLAQKLLFTLAKLAAQIEVFGKEDAAAVEGKTEEEINAVMKAMYESQDTVAVSVLKFDLDELGDTEVEPSAFQGLEQLVTD